MEHISELMEFLDSSLTSYHAVRNVRSMLLRGGFTELSEREVWQLETGGKYFVVRNDSSMMAFCIPACGVDGIKGYHVYAAHSDSPAFKIKEFPEIEKEGMYISVNTEKYHVILCAECRAIVRLPVHVDGKTRYHTRIFL